MPITMIIMKSGLLRKFVAPEAWKKIAAIIVRICPVPSQEIALAERRGRRNQPGGFLLPALTARRILCSFTRAGQSGVRTGPHLKNLGRYPGGTSGRAYSIACMHLR